MAFQGGSFAVALADGSAGTGDIASVANPEGVALGIVGTRLYITVPSTGASTIDVGVAANGITLSDTLIDGLSGATAGFYGSGKNGGTNGKLEQLWGSTQFVTASEASGNVADLEGWLIIDYVMLDFA